MIRGTASAQEIRRWNRWIESSDRNRSKAKQAASEILGFGFADPDLPSVEQQWQQLYEVTIGKSHSPYPNTWEKNTTLRWAYRTVAALLVVGAVGLASFFYVNTPQNMNRLEQMSQRKTVTTGESEQKVLTFSNGARITLNANTTLSYTLGLLSKEPIRIDLQGEAYFKTGSEDGILGEPVFTVATPDGIVEDVGTEFLVAVQDGHSRVVLQQGRVRITNKSLKGAGEEILANKGELIEFSEGGLLGKHSVNPSFYTSWATGFLEFEQTPVRELATFLEQRFDVYVQITNSNKASVTLDGAVHFRTLESLVRAVSEVTQINIYQSFGRDTLFIGDR